MEADFTLLCIALGCLSFALTMSINERKWHESLGR